MVILVDKQNNKKSFNIFNLIVNIIAFSAIILFICLIYFSNSNYNEVKNGNKPTGYKEEKNFKKNGRDITVYNYTLYKIVIIKYADTETYLLKPFFLSDYNGGK